MLPTVIPATHGALLLTGTSWMRLLPPSAMYRLPAESSAIPPGACRYAAVGGPVSPAYPEAPPAWPAMVYM